MKKILVVTAVLALISSLAFADIQLENNGSNVGIVTKLNVTGGTASRSGETGTIATNVFSSTIQVSGFNTGLTYGLSTISPNIGAAQLAFGLITIYGNSTVVNTFGLANGTAGQMATINFVKQGYNVIIGFPGDGITKSGWNKITFSATGQFVTLLYLDSTTGWIVVGVNGATIA